MTRTDERASLLHDGRHAGEPRARARRLLARRARAVTFTATIPRRRPWRVASSGPQHPFPTCVVCGPDRDPGDGYRIFPGRLAGDGLFAADWTPDPSLADDVGHVRPECLWGALDCPTSAPVANFGEGPPDGSCPASRRGSGAPSAWASATRWSRGRSKWTGASARPRCALFDEAGRLLCASSALWIELREPASA